MSASPKLREDLGFSNDFHTFVNSCLQKDITLRPSAEDLVTHPFVLMGQCKWRAQIEREREREEKKRRQDKIREDKRERAKKDTKEIEKRGAQNPRQT
jgi:hypothetical protein